jgi:hypothetical protein
VNERRLLPLQSPLIVFTIIFIEGRETGFSEVIQVIKIPIFALKPPKTNNNQYRVLDIIIF